MMKRLCFYVFCIGLVAACKKKQEPLISGLACIALSDDTGNPIGIYPDCELGQQWQNFPLNTEELAFLAFPDTISGNLSTAASIEKARAYPNPIAVDNPLYLNFSIDGSFVVKAKLAIVDKDGVIVQQLTQKLDNTRELTLAIPANLYTIGNFYRVFYQLSGANGLVFFEGYGNILVCQNTPLPNIEACT